MGRSDHLKGRTEQIRFIAPVYPYVSPGRHPSFMWSLTDCPTVDGLFFWPPEPIAPSTQGSETRLTMLGTPRTTQNAVCSGRFAARSEIAPRPIHSRRSDAVLQL